MVTHIPKFVRMVSTAACRAVRSIRLDHNDMRLLLEAFERGQTRSELRLFSSLEEVVIKMNKPERRSRLAVTEAIRPIVGRDVVVRFG